MFSLAQMAKKARTASRVIVAAVTVMAATVASVQSARTSLPMA